MRAVKYLLCASLLAGMATGCKSSPQAKVAEATQEAREETREAIQATNEAIVASREAREDYIKNLNQELVQLDQKAGDLEQRLANIRESREEVRNQLQNFTGLTGQMLVPARENLERAMIRLRNAVQFANRDSNYQ